MARLRWLGELAEAYRAVDEHTRKRLRQWLKRKHKLKGLCTKRYPDQYLHEELGQIRLELRTKSFSWAKA